MRPLLQHASRSFFASAASVVHKQSSRPFSTILNSISSSPFVCLQCHPRASNAFRSNHSSRWPTQNVSVRAIHVPRSESQQDDKKDASQEAQETAEERETKPEGKQASIREEPLPDVIELPSINSTTPSTSKVAELKTEGAKDEIKRVPAEDLPSHHHAQRWDLSKRFQDIMDDVLPKLAIVTQKVNTYTGTDYSGIAALKQEIKEHEQLVKVRRAAIEEAKHALDAAHLQQASSQKEVVALLERKHSWSATDLERYMSLIRSEHVNDHAVRQAKEAITSAESALEDARAQLERRERSQYHEEQIWSDTIRRNSTWVTFGLMGLNIFLLLATMIIIEPWRRRRMVREIKMALEAQKMSVESAAAKPVMAALPTEPLAAVPVAAPEIEKPTEAMEAVPLSPVATVSDDTASASEHEPEATVGDSAQNIPIVAEVPAAPVEELSAEPITPSLVVEETLPLDPAKTEEKVHSMATLEAWQERVTFIAKDVVSERAISMRYIDFTAAVLASAAAGAVITASIVAMIIQS